MTLIREESFDWALSGLIRGFCGKVKTFLSLLLMLAAGCATPDRAESVSIEQTLKAQVVAQIPLAGEIAEMLSKARQIELISLEPSEHADNKGKPMLGPKRFGFAVLGATMSTEPAEARTLASAIRDGILESSGEGVFAMCFDPRHALHFQDGADAVDLVICFECAHGYLECKGKKRWFSITRTPEKVLDEVFSAHGLQKAR